MDFKPLKLGKNRKTGFEFELASIEIDACSKILAELFDGKIEKKNSLDVKILCQNMGDFKVELDAHMIKNMVSKLEKKEPISDEDIIDINKIKSFVSKLIGDASGKFVPCEIVTPPMKFDDFSKLEDLRESLMNKGAEGTGASFVNAFGMHINTEIPSEEVSDIRDILRAFLILYPWLLEVMNIDISRRVLTYIDPFKKPYINLILDKDYNPSWDQFISDYIEHNPTRNRALDMMPLFAHLKPESMKLLKAEDRELIKARPTFHYRLPNCEMDNKNWSIARDWNYWVMVEELSADKEKLEAMSLEYLKFLGDPLNIVNSGWVKHISENFGYEKI
ncbi:amidoligase family protein [Rickettsiales bacterium]|nr:amidoligase family protein [Rickettsiales bacterium]